MTFYAAWMNVDRNDSLKGILKSDNFDEAFHQFVLEKEIPRTCEYLHSQNIPPRKYWHSPFGSKLLEDFCNYLMGLMSILYKPGSVRCIEILMQYRLPFDVYVSHNVGFKKWVHTSNINLFRLYLAQGYTIEMVKGYVEVSIVYSGNVDVLDYFLSLETPESGHVLNYDVMTHVCMCKNVDMLDRLINKGYPVNVMGIHDQYPIELSFCNSYRETYILDRLIMAGANVNIHEIKFQSTSLLFRALDSGIMNCFQRLLDVGARVNNAADVERYFKTRTINRETLTLLVKGGMDLNYVSEHFGTPIDMVTKRYRMDDEKREEVIALIKELGGR